MPSVLIETLVRCSDRHRGDVENCGKECSILLWCGLGTERQVGEATNLLQHTLQRRGGDMDVGRLEMLLGQQREDQFASAVGPAMISSFPARSWRTT